MVETWLVAAVAGPKLKEGWMPFHTSVTRWVWKEPLKRETMPAVQLALGAAQSVLPDKAFSKKGCAGTVPPARKAAATASKA